MRSFIWIFLLCFTNTSIVSGQFKPRFIESKNPPVTVGEGQAFIFGYLEVLENREKPTGPTLRLPVYIFKSRNPNPKPHPVLLTLGGPGNSSLGAAAYMKYYRYLDDRDLILFEQRGARYAEPTLSCPEWSQAARKARDPRFSAGEALELKRAAAKKCKSRLRDEGIDLNAYTTRAIAADVEDLRRVLNINQWNLLTVSYSTKIAQVLMRDYPGTIRSVIMDSPLPLEVNYDEESVANLIQSFSNLFKDCRTNEDCREKYGDLEEDFFQLLQYKTADPWLVPARELILPYRGRDILSTLDVGSTYEIPGLIDKIAQLCKGDATLLAESADGLFEEADAGYGIGMRLSVWCAEELAFASDKVIQREKSAYPGLSGLSPAVFEREICDVWGVKPEAASENRPVESTLPVLLINGEYDPDTPPKWAEAMLARLKNGHHLVFRGYGHLPVFYWPDPCAMEMANAFFNDPTKKPDLPCFSEIQSPDFVSGN